VFGENLHRYSLTAEIFRACVGLPTGACGVMKGSRSPVTAKIIARKPQAYVAGAAGFFTSGELTR